MVSLSEVSIVLSKCVDIKVDNALVLTTSLVVKVGISVVVAWMVVVGVSVVGACVVGVSVVGVYVVGICSSIGSPTIKTALATCLKWPSDGVFITSNSSVSRFLNRQVDDPPPSSSRAV